MCLVTGLAIGSAVLGVAGTIVGAAGQIQAGDAASRAAQYQAQVARNNAIIAEQRAGAARAAGMRKASDAAMAAAAKEARLRTTLAAQGVDINTGSAVDVQAGQRMTDKLDVETVLHDSELEAYGYRSQAQNFRSRASLYDMEAEAAGDAAGMRAATTILGGASAITGGLSRFNWSGGGGSVTTDYSQGNRASGYGTYEPGNAPGWS